jgi:hypothetical protein
LLSEKLTEDEQVIKVNFDEESNTEYTNKKTLESAEAENVAGDEIELMPDMSKVWARVLKGLRETGEAVLLAACMEINDIEFTDCEIHVYCKNKALYELFRKYTKELTKHAGADCLRFYEPRVQKHDQKKIEALKKIFGDELKIKK